MRICSRNLKNLWQHLHSSPYTCSTFSEFICSLLLIFLSIIVHFALCMKNTVSLMSSTTSGFYNLSNLHLQRSLCFGRRSVILMSQIGLSIPVFILCMSIKGLSVNCCLLEGEGSLLTDER